MGIFKTKKQPEAGVGAAQTSSEMQDFVQREMEKIFGRRGPAHLVALSPDPGVAEPGRGSWAAIPAWDPGDLEKKPVTYVPSATPGGVQSSLMLLVNGVRWSEVPTLYGASPSVWRVGR